MRVATDFKNLKVGLAFNFFDSLAEIPRALGDPNNPRAVCNNVDYMFCMDGRFRFFDCDHDYSEDGGREYIEKTYSNAIVEKFSGEQVAKRQRAFDLAGKYKCDFLIVLDSDDYLHKDFQDWDLFYSNLYKYSLYNNDFLFKMKAFINPNWKKHHNRVKNGSFKEYIRIHKNPGQQRYAMNRHYWWTLRKYSDEYIVTHDMKPIKLEANYTIDGIRLDSDSLLRNKDYLKAGLKWAQINTDFEEYMLGAAIQKYKKKIPYNEDLNPFKNMR